MTRIVKSSLTVTLGCLLSVLALFGVSEAYADPIVGNIGFAGAWTPRDSAGNTTGIATASRVDVTGDQAFVVAATGNFTGLFLKMANYYDFTFDPFASTTLWQVAGFTFNLSSLSVNIQTASFLGLTGTGTVSGNGFTPTAFNWSFSGEGSNGTFNFSNAGSAAVPEPSTLLLFGTGLIGVAVAVRRGRQANGRRARA